MQSIRRLPSTAYSSHSLHSGDVMANEAGAIVRCASTLGDRGYKRTLLQQFVMLYVIHV